MLIAQWQAKNCIGKLLLAYENTRLTLISSQSYSASRHPAQAVQTASAASQNKEKKKKKKAVL